MDTIGGWPAGLSLVEPDRSRGGGWMSRGCRRWNSVRLGIGARSSRGNGGGGSRVLQGDFGPLFTRSIPIRLAQRIEERVSHKVQSHGHEQSNQNPFLPRRIGFRLLGLSSGYSPVIERFSSTWYNGVLDTKTQALLLAHRSRKNSQPCEKIPAFYTSPV